MRTIDQRSFRLKSKRQRVPKWLRWSLLGLSVLIVLFVLANVAVGLLYRNKVLPNYSVASEPIGNIAFSELDQKVPVEKLLPTEVTFKKDTRTKPVTPKDLGVQVDWPATREHLTKNRSWLPLLSFFKKQSVPAELEVDNAQFALTAKSLAKYFSQAPTPERIVFQNGNFAIAPPKTGYELEVVPLRLALVGLLEQGKMELSVPTKTTRSTEPTGQLGSDLASLQRQLNAKITLSTAARSKQLTRGEIGRFYKADGQSMALSASQMAQVIAEVAKSFGLTAVNQTDAVQAALYAINKAQTINFRLAAQGATVHRYCVAPRGLSSSVIPEFRQKLAAVYGDPQGWSKGGIAFVYAESGCDYTAWLSAAARVTDFSASVCDNYYSCRIGANVIINYDRWRGATPPWNAAGGTLENYRVMVINHETGHWLGFGHRNCPGAGQPAPVMQQQSIGLQGCKFNPWPTAAEIASL